MNSQRKIHILEVHGRMRTGGIETFLMNTLRNIDRNKFQITFLCYMDSDKVHHHEAEISSLGSKIIKIRDNRTKHPLKFIRGIEEVIKKEQIDIVHAQSTSSMVHTLIAAKRAGIKVRIAHSHNTRFLSSLPKVLRPVLLTPLKTLVNQGATLRLACGSSAGKALFGSKSKVITMENGINVEQFEYSVDARAKVRKQYVVRQDDVVLTNVARLDKAKNPLFLIDVFHEYQSRFNANSKLLLVGDGELRRKIENYINRLGLGDKIILAGRQSNVPDYLSASDILVSPSLFEGFPITLIEAQASGLLCVVSSAISKEVDITNTVHFVSLSKTASEWAKEIDSIDKKRHLENYGKILDSGYNVINSVNKLEKIYQEAYEKSR